MSLAGRNICVVSPFAVDVARGNATTAARIANRLRQGGAQVTVVVAPKSEGEEPTPAFFAAMDAADTIVGIHARHLARSLAAARIDPQAPPARRPRIALVIGGNDVYEDLGGAPSDQANGMTQPASAELLRHADAVIVSSEHQRQAALDLGNQRVFLVPRCPEVGHAPIQGFDQSLAALPPGPTLAWCGALRSQKRPEWILPILNRVRANHPGTRLLLLGPPPLTPEARALEASLQEAPHILRIPLFPSGPTESGGAMGTLLAAVDISLNTSRTEGLSNFLLESMHEAVPVVAAAAKGTASWIADQAQLFNTVEQAADAIIALLDDASSRWEWGQRGQAWLRDFSSAEREAGALHAALSSASISKL